MEKYLNKATHQWPTLLTPDDRYVQSTWAYIYVTRAPDAPIRTAPKAETP